MDILRQLEKEVYIADYEDLGAKACRILVPDYSEIYLPEDLIWDNNNQALQYRSDILNIHTLDDSALENLAQRLEESELDNYIPISELIGIAFDENSTWGELVIGELKCLIYLALKKYEDAKFLVDMLMTFSDHGADRKKYFRALDTVLDITLSEDMNIEDYTESMTKMFGSQTLENAIKTVTGEVRFSGLTATDNNLMGLEKHQKLLESYQKLQSARKAYLHKSR